jgi:hypothetical protein
MEDKLFIWYDSDSSRNRDTELYLGPHYDGDCNVVGGKNTYHRLSDLLKMRVSDNLKLRFTRAKIGTNIKVHYLHSSGNLMVKCVSEDKLDLLNEVKDIDAEKAILSAKLRALENKRNELTKKIFNNDK